MENFFVPSQNGEWALIACLLHTESALCGLLRHQVGHDRLQGEHGRRKDIEPAQCADKRVSFNQNSGQWSNQSYKQIGDVNPRVNIHQLSGGSILHQEAGPGMYVIRQKLLTMPAARKYQKFCAAAEINAGTVQERMSKTSVVRRRPILSVSAPPTKAITTWNPSSY